MTPAWAEVIATCVGVLINAGVVIVALLPIHRAKRLQQARGLLTAAYFQDPFSRAYKQMFLGCADLKVVADTNADVDRPELLVSMGRLSALPDRVLQLLGKFSLEDAAYLDANQGKQLAMAVGEARAVLEVLTVATKKFNATTTSFEAMIAHTVEGPPLLKVIDAFAKARRNVIKEFQFLPGQFESATDHLGKFAEYCEGLFSSGAPRPQ